MMLCDQKPLLFQPVFLQTHIISFDIVRKIKLLFAIAVYRMYVKFMCFEPKGRKDEEVYNCGNGHLYVLRIFRMRQQ